MLRKSGRIAVGGGGGRVYDSLYASIARGDQGMHGTIDVGLIAAERILYRFWHRRDGRFVEHAIHALTGFADGFERLGAKRFDRGHPLQGEA